MALYETMDDVRRDTDAIFKLDKEYTSHKTTNPKNRIHREMLADRLRTHVTRALRSLEGFMNDNTELNTNDNTVLKNLKSDYEMMLGPTYGGRRKRTARRKHTARRKRTTRT